MDVVNDVKDNVISAYFNSWLFYVWSEIDPILFTKLWNDGSACGTTSFCFAHFDDLIPCLVLGSGKVNLFASNSGLK